MKRVLTTLSQRIEMRYAMTPMTVEELSFYMKEPLRHMGEERMIFAANTVAVHLGERYVQGRIEHAKNWYVLLGDARLSL